MRVSIRRTLRVGALAGTPVEDLGVVTNERHHMTRDDLINGNVDLLDRAGEILKACPCAGSTSRRHARDGALEVASAVANVDRVDLYVDGRPFTSVDSPPGASTLTLPDVPRARIVRAEGFAGGELVVARTVAVA